MTDPSFRARLNAAAPAFATELARTAFERGLAVTKPDGSRAPISITAAPVVVDERELARRARLAHLLSSATLKASRATLASARRDLILDALSPLEASLARDTFKSLSVLATTRVDFLEGRGLGALELNATIPAMQGYSDIARDAFLDVVGRHLGASPSMVDAWKAREPSNAAALYRALLAGAARVRPARPPSWIAILARRQDAQLTELTYLRDRFRAFGTRAEIAYPDEIEERGDVVVAHGAPLDVVYRHLFVRRLEEAATPGADVVARLLAEENGKRVIIMNPPASQVEVKSVFALLSEAADDDAGAEGLGLTNDERAAVREAVPWTRVLEGDSLVDRIAAEPDRYVLKRAWDYGGRAVFVGRAREDASFRERVRSAFPHAKDDVTWPELCALAAADARGGGFVVQELVDATPVEHVVCSTTGALAAPLTVDFSAYASVGLDDDPGWGGVCRGSTSSIVNIMGGGGLVPLVSADTARAMEELLPRPIS
jgi:hypothetical protein